MQAIRVRQACSPEGTPALADKMRHLFSTTSPEGADHKVASGTVARAQTALECASLRTTSVKPLLVKN